MSVALHPSGPIKEPLSGGPLRELQLFVSTASVDEQRSQQATPLMKSFVWDIPDWLRSGNHDHLSWETPFREQAGAHGLGSARHDHQTVPVVAHGILPRPSRFAPRVVGDVEEAHDRNPGHLGARRVVRT